MQLLSILLLMQQGQRSHQMEVQSQANFTIIERAMLRSSDDLEPVLEEIFAVYVHPSRLNVHFITPKSVNNNGVLVRHIIWIEDWKRNI